MAYVAPAVQTALFEILKSLSVEKGGSLPSNMGGKPYITAVDLNSEIKRKFVEHNLFFLPTETEVSKEIVTNPKGGTVVTVSIQGEYTIISTTDGSQVTIGGVGDGYATGTAVASNIASTNALKNALLRTFLVTEQSTEDAAKNGPAEPREDRAVAQAKNPSNSGLNEARNELTALTGGQAEAKKAGDRFFRVEPGQPSTWSSDEAQVRKLIAHIQATGEV